MNRTPSPLDIAGNATSATNFLLIHHGLRPDADAFSRAVRTPWDGELGALQQRFSDFAAILEDHGHSEDGELFPALVALTPKLGSVMAQLEAEHAAIEPQVAAAMDALGRIATDQDAAVTALGELAVSLDNHLTFEEQHLLPVMIDSGLGNLQRGDDGAGARSTLPMHFLGPWCGAGLPPEILDGVIATLPPPLASAWPDWRDAFAASDVLAPHMRHPSEALAL